LPLRSTSLRSLISLLTVRSSSIVRLCNSNFPCGPSKSRRLVPTPGFPFNGVPVIRYPVPSYGSPDIRKRLSMSPGSNLQIALAGFPKAVTWLHFPVFPVGFINLLHRGSRSAFFRRSHRFLSSCGES
jgi:hypothetical protein